MSQPPARTGIDFSVFGIASSFQEMERLQEEQNRMCSYEERFQATVELVSDAWYLEGNNGPAPGIDFTTYGVRKFER